MAAGFCTYNMLCNVTLTASFVSQSDIKSVELSFIVTRCVPHYVRRQFLIILPVPSSIKSPA